MPETILRFGKMISWEEFSFDFTQIYQRAEKVIKMALLKKINFSHRINRKLVILAALIIVPLVVVEIWTMNRLSTVGEGIAELQASKAHLELENAVLKNKISERKSLFEVEKKSKSLGFEKMSKIEYIENEPGLALNKNP